MKMDQIAYYCIDQYAAAELKESLGLEKADWITDQVTAQSKVWLANNTINAGENVAELQFNYSLGIELEIIRYISGPHWHMLYTPRCFISHVGVHLDNGEPFPIMSHAKIVQETRTISHTSEYLTQPGSPGYGRKYHYRIYEVGPHSYIKFIKRLNNEQLGSDDQRNILPAAEST